MVNSLLLGTICRTALVIISYGCKVPCGIFVPSMAVGAMFGRMIGILMKAMHTLVACLYSGNIQLTRYQSVP
jgi:chloride channel 3/4/5